MSYQVEEIAGRKVYSGKVLYLVKWKGSDQPSWQSIKLLKNFKHLIKEYNEKFKNEDGRPDEFEDHKEIKEIKTKRGRPRKLAHALCKENLEVPSDELFFESDAHGSQKDKGSIDILDEKQEEFIDKRQQTYQNRGKRTKTRLPVYELTDSVDSTTSITKQEIKTDTESNHGMTNMAGLAENSKQILPLLKKIYFIEKSSSHRIQYLVEYSDNSLSKCFSQELVEKYPKELIKFLEGSLLNKRSK